MVSELPKVLHPVLFRPMVHHVLDLAMALPHASIHMVVGHGDAAVREACAEPYKGLEFLTQKEPLGTGDAVKTAEPVLRGKRGPILVLSGDVILLRRASLEKLLELHQERGSACTLSTARLPNPHGYGRILRSPDGGSVTAIREEVDCTAEERKRDEVNAGIYCFENEAIFDALSRVTASNRQKEYYLTDAIAELVAKGKKVTALCLQDPSEMEGINDRKALSEVQSLLQMRVNEEWMRKGVTLSDPRTIFIDARCHIESDVTIEAGCQLLRSTVERGAVIESGTRVIDSQIAAGCRIKQGSYLEKCRVGKNASVGPYAHLRPGTVLGERVKIGNFVEVKNSRLGEASKASHLSYIGDAEVGRDVNLGCGFITCNYDGFQKHTTVIGDRVFIGSDSQTIAPVTVGDDSYIASGTTVTGDVPPGALAISRSFQVNKECYAAKIRAKKNRPLK